MPRTAAILASLPLLAAAIASPAWARGPLTPETAASGAPMSEEQSSVDFATADLSIEVFPAKKAIAGTAVLGFTVRRPIARIQFDLDRDLPISAVAVDGAALPRGSWVNPRGRATVTLPRRYAAGESLTLTIDYAGTPHVAKRAPWDGGFVWSKTKAGAPWIATAVQGEGCDLFWPCIDHPTVEVGVVELHITVPDGLVAPANGRFMGSDRPAPGKTRWNWRTKRPNSYAIALTIAPYRQLSASYRSRFGNVIPLHYWYLPGAEAEAQALFAEFAPTLDFFETVIGPYPFGDEKVAAVETPHLGMEHQTINAYGNGYKKAPEGYDWLFHHEFSHEWFGNQLTNADWDHMWLHEGLGTYMQPLYMRWRTGEQPYQAWLWKQRAALANRFPIVSGQSRTEEQVYDGKTGPGLDIYYKGAWVMHVLRGLIGDEAFFRTVRRSVYGRADPAPGNFAPRFGTTDEFVALAEEESGRPLKWFFDVYLRRDALPRLAVVRDGRTLSLAWQEVGDVAFAMPVEVGVGGRTVSVGMPGGTGRLTLPSDDAHYVIDPAAKLLRQSDDIDAFKAWEAKQAKPAK